MSLGFQSTIGTIPLCLMYWYRCAASAAESWQKYRGLSDGSTSSMWAVADTAVSASCCEAALCATNTGRSIPSSREGQLML